MKGDSLSRRLSLVRLVVLGVSMSVMRSLIHMLGSRECLIRKAVGDGKLMGRTLTANIRERRGSLVDIRLPLFVDENTEVPEGMKKVLSGGVPRKSASVPLSRTMAYAMQHRQNRQRGLPISTWTLWPSGWDALVYRSHSRHGTWRRRVGCMMLWFP